MTEPHPEEPRVTRALHATPAALPRAAGLVLFVLLALLPMGIDFDRHYLLTLSLAYLFAGLAVSWFLLARAGQISLGHAAFFGLGAYTSALSAVRFGISPWLGLLLGAGLAALFAVPVGFVCFRFRGLYFALGTFAAAEVAKAIVLNWDSLTYGAQGLVGIPSLPAFTVGPWHLDFAASRLPNYYVMLAFLALTLTATHRVLSGRLGLAFTAVRESEDVAQAIGIDTTRTKAYALLVSAAISGAGGALYAHLLHFLVPDLAFDVSLSGLPLIMSLFGGLASLAGPLVGALALYLGDELILQVYFPTAHQMLYGATLMFVVLYMPGGLIGWLHTRFDRLRKLLGSGSASDPEARSQPALDLAAAPRASETAGASRTRRGYRIVDSPPPWASNGRPVLETRGVSRRFNGLVAVDGVSLAARRQEIVGLVGPNGSGKTTLINIITGHLDPTAGQVLLAGRDITALPAHARCHLGVAHTFQTVRPFDHLTVLDNVAVAAVYGGPRRTPLKRAREQAAHLLELVDLSRPAGDLAGTLSMGQRKRLELARALATRPTVLLLDEIGAGLTPAAGAAMRRLLTRLRDEGLTIIGVEHALHTLTDIVDRLVVLDKGRIVADGPPDAVLDDPDVRTAFIGE